MKYGQIQPVKVYYSIREVAQKLGVPVHRLRYWESQFPILRPKKNRSGIRQYRDTDLELLQSIYRLTQNEGKSCPEALRILRLQRTPKPPPLTRPKVQIEVLKNLRNEVWLTLEMLKGTL